MRTWTSVNSNTLVARFDRLQGSYVILQAEDERRVSIEFTTLSEADQVYLRESTGELNHGGTWSIGYSDITFFNQPARTKALGILVDISTSMAAKQAIPKVQAEVKSMLKELNLKTSFTIIAFVDGQEAINNELLEASTTNIAIANAWMATLRENQYGNKSGYIGSSPLDALQLAVKQGVDTIFLLTDDVPGLWQIDEKREKKELTSHPNEIVQFVKEIRTTYGRDVKINPIIYKSSKKKASESKHYWTRIANITGGKLTIYDDEK